MLQRLLKTQYLLRQLGLPYTYRILKPLKARKVKNQNRHQEFYYNHLVQKEKTIIHTRITVS
ncbi:hypothetical protein BJI68_26025 [Escherichia coli]|nr:hypothetical protein BJI68_26025 [Escherichia coli]